MKRVFVLGNPRSGTSMFRLMINAHPEMVCPPECGFLHWWSKKYLHWNFDEQGFEVVLKDVLQSKKIEAWNLDYDKVHDFISEKKPDNYAGFCALIYEFYGLSRGKQTIKVVADKNNYYINHLADLFQIWSDAVFVHVVRDVRDVAASYKDLKKLNTDSAYKPALSADALEIAHEWMNNNASIADFIQLNKINSITIKYEDLVLNTSSALANFCNFLGIEFSDVMLKFYLPEFHDEPASTMDWKKKTLAPPDASSVGSYKTRLAQKEISEIEIAAAEMLRAFNY